MISEIVIEMASAQLSEEPLQNRLEFALSRLWRAMQDLPPAVRTAYQALDELDLETASAARAAAYSLVEVPPWRPNTNSGLEALVRAVAIEIRAADQALHECRDPGRSENPEQDYLAFGSEAVFIIPKRCTPAGRRGQLFDRRGLRYHRIIPLQVEGFEVRLHSPSVRGPGMDGSPTNLVSAMFNRADLEIAKVGEDFRVKRLADLPGVSAQLKDQLSELGGYGPCMAVAWPELMMPPELLGELTDRLGGQALDDAPIDLGFLVAGSWHIDRPSGCVNCAMVLDRDGAILLEVHKHEPFELKPGMLEAIRPGEHLPILLYGDLLVAFAICKDFCERRHSTPYSLLDVDLVIVPSLANAATMGEHAEAAKTLDVRYGARCFVVQQLFDITQPEETWGMVLAPAAEPRGRRRTPVRQDKLLDRTSISCTIP